MESLSQEEARKKVDELRIASNEIHVSIKRVDAKIGSNAQAYFLDWAALVEKIGGMNHAAAPIALLEMAERQAGITFELTRMGHSDLAKAIRENYTAWHALALQVQGRVSIAAEPLVAKTVEPLSREAALDAIDDLVERQTMVVIKLTQLNQSELGKEVHELTMAWRALALNVGGIVMGELEDYRRLLKRKGEY